MQLAVLLDLFVFTTQSSYEVKQQLVMLPVNVCVEACGDVMEQCYNRSQLDNVCTDADVSS